MHIHEFDGVTIRHDHSEHSSLGHPHEPETLRVMAHMARIDEKRSRKWLNDHRSGFVLRRNVQSARSAVKRAMHELEKDVPQWAGEGKFCDPKTLTPEQRAELLDWLMEIRDVADNLSVKIRSSE